MSDDEHVEITPGDRRLAGEIMRNLRESPVASSLPTGRARALTERLGVILGWSDEKIDAVMEERSARLDEAARRTEHER